MDNATTGQAADARSLADTETNGTAEEGHLTRTRHRPGLTIRTFSVAQDGTRYDDSGVTSATPGPDEYVARIEVWPACACPQHRAG
ncbi:hypothetical protein [Kitasatospora brasiliensis]|uniref:hypothetical protein n=1 Tax=Kitasatospora brasiliensis TaxID=3058040 RepID=UPI00292E1745|nr:hypothetical protein [Kitasatospora sp. K002]